MPTYPADFPALPEDALDADGTYFRICVTKPPTTEDFKSYKELGKPTTAAPIHAVGISMYTDLDKARHRQRLSPRLGKFIAEGDLTPEHGKTSRPGGNGHLEWWPFDGVDRLSPFLARDAHECP